MRDRWPLLAGLTLIAVALFFGSLALARGIRDRGTTNVVTVTGSAKTRVTSDFAAWNLSVQSLQGSAPSAAAQLSQWTTAIRTFLSTQGIDGSEVTVQPVSTEQVTSDNADGSPGPVVGYRVTRNFQVRSRRVGVVAAAAEASSKLIAKGVPLQAEPLQYVFTKLASLRPRLLAEAVRDAQQRGRVLVGATGGSIGKLRGVDVGVFQVTSPNSTDVTDYGVYDTSTLRKDVTAVVNVTFTLK